MKSYKSFLIYICVWLSFTLIIYSCIQSIDRSDMDLYMGVHLFNIVSNYLFSLLFFLFIGVALLRFFGGIPNLSKLAIFSIFILSFVFAVFPSFELVEAISGGGIVICSKFTENKRFFPEICDYYAKALVGTLLNTFLFSVIVCAAEILVKKLRK